MRVSRQHCRRGAAVLAAGGVIAYPTEAVYGLGCDPLNARAVERLLALKRRPRDRGFILIAAAREQLAPYIGPLEDTAVVEAMDTSWPGPTTWLVPPAVSVPRWLTGRFSTLAVRVTAHPIAAALCEEFGAPIVSTSANRHGAAAARTALKVRAIFGRELDGIVPGPVGGRRNPTEIRDARTGIVIRKA